MAINFGQFVFQPRPLQQWNIGEGLGDIIQGNRERARLSQDESQYSRTRNDTQSTNAANYARDTSKADYDARKGRYDKQAKAIADARAAAQSGHYDVADALIPTIKELGGQAEMRGDQYFFKEGDAPTIGAPDVGGARRQIYQGAPPGVGANQPFQVPGFGAGGQRNPFAPPALPGASAAALPQPPQAAPPGAPPPPAAGPPPGAAPPPAAPELPPPPGAAVDGPRTPPPGSVWQPPEAPIDYGASSPAAPEGAALTPDAATAPGAPLEIEGDLARLEAATTGDGPAEEGATGATAEEPPTGPNPFAPPGLDDPYVIDPSKVRERNRQRLEPFLGGVANAAGSRFKGRIEDINKYVNELGLPPDEAIKLTEKLYGEIFGLARGELAMEGQAGRAATTARHQESVQYDKDRDRGLRIAKERLGLYDLKGTRKKLEVSRGVEDLLKSAHRNGATANALIRQVYNMYASGVMTDNDYTDTKEGVSNLYQRVKNRTLQELNPHGGGLPPDVIDDMKELVEVALRGHRRVAAETSDSLYRAYKANRNEAEREALRESFSAFDPEFLPPEFNPQANGGVPEVADEQAEMERLRAEEPGSQIDPRSYDPTDGPPPLGFDTGSSGGAGDNVGVVPIPKEPNRAGAPRGTRVPEKPPRKQKSVRDMTPEERKARAKELLRKSQEP